YDGKTDVMHWSQSASAPGTPAPGPGNAATRQALSATKQAGSVANDATKQAANASLDATKRAAAASGRGTPAGAEPDQGTPVARPNAGSKPAWSPLETGDGATFPDLLAGVDQRGCGTAQRQADATDAGRAAYVIAVTSNGACGSKPGMAAAGDRLIVRVDQQTFLTLGFEQYKADGSLLSSYEVTSIAY